MYPDELKNDPVPDFSSVKQEIRSRVTGVIRSRASHRVSPVYYLTAFMFFVSVLGLSFFYAEKERSAESLSPELLVKLISSEETVIELPDSLNYFGEVQLLRLEEDQ